MALILVTYPITFLLAIAPDGASPPGSERNLELERLVRAQGAEYSAHRDAALERFPNGWDVDSAAADSWDSGLVAFILNARLSHQQDFISLEAQVPRRDIMGRYWKPSESTEATIAFLLETMWKGGLQKSDRRFPEREPEYAYQTLRQLSLYRSGTAKMWLAIWVGSPDERYKFLSLEAICADPSLTVQPVIEQFLTSGDDSLAGFRSKGRCLGALVHRDTEGSVDAVLAAWPTLRDQGYTANAIGALAANSSDRARAFVHSFIVDPGGDARQRVEALAKLCVNPKPNDADILRRLLQSEVIAEAKGDALLAMAKCPAGQILPVLREILATGDDAELVARAGLVMSAVYRRNKDIMPMNRAEDIALLESVRRRDSIPHATHVHFGTYIEVLKGELNPELP